jgi:membrane-bound ClpP family serine protease
VTADQVIPAAFAVVLLVLVVAGVARIFGRRRGQNEDAFGAGGTSTVPLGAQGVSRTVLAPSGVAYVVGEEWTVRSVDDKPIAAGARVRVVGQTGLTLMVVEESADRPAEG